MANPSQVLDTFKGRKVPGFTPVLPIYHTAASLGSGISMKEFASDADKLAEAMLWAYNKFNFDGVQLTLGVGMEAEALGAKTAQSEKGLPAVTEYLLEDISNLKRLKIPDGYNSGRMPVFLEAVNKIQKNIRDKAIVVATVRGPFVIAGQLRGIEPLMLDGYDNPDFVKELLEFCTEISFNFAEALIKAAGVKVIAFGEALCSPDFISPDFYKEMIAPLHKKLMQRVHTAGLEAAIIHICGNIAPIFDTILNIGVDAADIDAKTDLKTILEMNKNAGKPLGLRGNLEPAWLLKAAEKEVEEKSLELLCQTNGAPWILSSGCDVPYGTPDANMSALSRSAKRENI
ncbi:MAG: uroporphyrinogen decarboxylase family protein [Candidatus Firestonebacteria bacterium]